MQRNLVQVARIRLEEVVPGDVVNKDSEVSQGWFLVGIVEELFDGTLNISDAFRRESFAAMPHDICGVQNLKPVELPTAEDAPEVIDALADKKPDEEESKEAEPQPVG